PVDHDGRLVRDVPLQAFHIRATSQTTALPQEPADPRRHCDDDQQGCERPPRRPRDPAPVRFLPVHERPNGQGRYHCTARRGGIHSSSPQECADWPRRSLLEGERSGAMRIHGVLRLAAAPAIALALVATPAVARQSSTEVRPKTEPKPSAPAAVSRPPAVQSRPASPPPSRPAIERSTPRSSPSNQFRMPRFERPIDRETLRGPEVIRTPASLRRGEPRTNSRTNARMTTRSALAPTRVIDPSLILDDDVAVTLRLDDFSPIERARILLELQELMDRHLGANEES